MKRLQEEIDSTERFTANPNQDTSQAGYGSQRSTSKPRAYTRRIIITNVKEEVLVSRRLKTLRLEDSDIQQLNRIFGLLSKEGNEKKVVNQLFVNNGNLLFSFPFEDDYNLNADTVFLSQALTDQIAAFNDIQGILKATEPIKFTKRSKMPLLVPQLLTQIATSNPKRGLSFEQIAAKYNQEVIPEARMSTSTLFRHTKALNILEYKDTKPRKFTISYSGLSLETKLFIAEVSNLILRYNDFIFVDEATIQPHENNTKRWQIANSKLFIPTQTRMPSIKLILAINYKGVVYWETSDQNTNQFIFGGFVRQMAAILRQTNNLQKKDEINQVLIMDNASWHLTDYVKQQITVQKLKVVYLPPYSPHLNAVELCFGHIKQRMRQNMFETTESFY